VRIAVLGSGNIGTTVGAALARAGHEVVFGSRHPDEASVPPSTSVDAIPDALAGAEAVLLAVPAAAVDELLSAHASALAGVLVIDATNHVGAAVVNASAAIKAAAPAARYVRAFNSLGWENFADPMFDDGPADLLFAAAEADRDAAEGLIAAVGLRPVYVGEDPSVVDGVLPLWFALVKQSGGNRRTAFRVIRK
jgi:predicted dinucleotide-binding enzyme